MGKNSILVCSRCGKIGKLRLISKKEWNYVKHEYLCERCYKGDLKVKNLRERFELEAAKAAEEKGCSYQEELIERLRKHSMRDKEPTEAALFFLKELKKEKKIKEDDKLSDLVIKDLEKKEGYC